MMMNIQLNGYYDKNIGDDIMQRLVVRAFPEHTFFVNPPQREMMAHLEDEPNVVWGTTNDIMVNVIGTGFLFNSTISKVSKILAKTPPKYGRCAVVDCSIEPVNGRLSALFTKNALMRYDHITCRDAYSLEFIKGHTKKERVYFYPDIVFNQPVPERSGECLGIAPVRRVYNDVNYTYYRSLAKAADLFVETYGERVLLFAFNNGVENDISACGSIRCMMKHGGCADIVVYNSDIDSFLRKMSECRMFICSRFHSAVIALMEKIPFIAVSDTHKLKDLADVYGFEFLNRDDESGAIDKFIKNPCAPVRLSPDVITAAHRHISMLKEWIDR